MKINFKKTVIILSTIILTIYALFLLIPFILSPIANSYTNDLEKFIENTTGLEAKLEELRITTSPKLSVGIKLKDFELYIPKEKQPFFKSENFKINLALLPIIFKKIQLDSISVQSLKAEISMKNDGSLILQDYIKPQQNDDTQTQMTELPYGFKLSNKLPDIHTGEYKLAIIDSNRNKSYSLQGEKFNIIDFILDKKIKISTNGKLVFHNDIISNYDIKILNKIMPDIQLNDIIFPKEIQIDQEEIKTPQNNTISFNILDTLNSIHQNKLHADINANISTSGTLDKPIQKGHFSINGISVEVNGVQLPKSYANLDFKGHKTNIESTIYTSKDTNEKTEIKGFVKSGNNKAIDLTLNSNAKFNNLIRLTDSIAQSFGINDFKTITATGNLDANLNIKSDFKTIKSNGYLKINPSSIKHGMYNVSIDNITADINCANNNINIKNSNFNIMGHPLKIKGTIKEDSQTDLTITANDVLLKGLLVLAGQNAILKENTINNGKLSLNAKLEGKFNDIKPNINIAIKEIDIYNKPNKIKLNLADSLIKIILNKQSFIGDINVKSLVAKNPTASISVPSANIDLNEKDVLIKNSYMMLNNSKMDITGKINDYNNDKLNIDIKANGNLTSSDIMAFIPKEFHTMFPHKGKLPANIAITGNNKTQNISFDLIANGSNYIQFADINLLKGKNTKIHSDMKISSDTLTFLNSGIYANEKQIGCLKGSINKLSSQQKLNLEISVPQTISFPIWGVKTSNISANGDLKISGTLMSPQIRGILKFPDISIKELDFAISNIVGHINSGFFAGNATANKFKVGNIIATNLNAKFALNNTFTDFDLTDITAEAFEGKVNGKLLYKIPTYAIGLDLTGKNLNSTAAVYGATGIKNALTGKMNFNTSLKMKGLTDTEIIKSMQGNIVFDITDGKFVKIGRLENFISAQNISSGTIFGTFLSKLPTLATIQKTDKFKSISGNITMSKGSAILDKIIVQGELMSYYVHGSYNIIPNSAYLTILGRLDGTVISALGVLGQMSADKILGYIPGIGNITAAVLKQLTLDPKSENIALIPNLTNGSEVFKDFKVIFNGPVESSKSVKSFKWLSKCEVQPVDIKKELNEAKEATKTAVKEQIETTKKNIETVKTNIKDTIEEQKRAIQQTKQDIQNIKNSFKELGKTIKNKGQTETQTETKQVTPQENSTPATTTAPATTTTNTPSTTIQETATTSETSETNTQTSD